MARYITQVLTGHIPWVRFPNLGLSTSRTTQNFHTRLPMYLSEHYHSKEEKDP